MVQPGLWPDLFRLAQSMFDEAHWSYDCFHRFLEIRVQSQPGIRKLDSVRFGQVGSGRFGGGTPTRAAELQSDWKTPNKIGPLPDFVGEATHAGMMESD